MDYLDYKYQDVLQDYWTVMTDTGETEEYIDLNFSANEERYRHYYFKKPTSLSLDTDTTEIPEEYGVELVALLAS